MNWTEDEARYLDRMALRLERELGRRVTRTDVLRGLVGVAMEEDALFSPQPVSDEPASSRLGLPELLAAIRLAYHR